MNLKLKCYINHKLHCNNVTKKISVRKKVLSSLELQLFNWQPEALTPTPSNVNYHVNHKHKN